MSEAAARPPATSLPFPLCLFLFVSLSLTAVSLLFGLGARSRHLDHRYVSPLLPSDTNFGDLLIFVRAMPYLGTPAFFHTGPRFAYPPAAILIYKTAYLFPHRTSVFLAFVLLSVACLVVLFARALTRRGLSFRTAFSFSAASAIFAFPLWFEVQRANIEFCIFLLCVAGAWCFLSGRRSLAGVIWGIATAIKLFPVFLLGVLCRRGNARALLLALLSAAAATLLGLRLLDRNLLSAAREIVTGLAGFTRDYTGAIRTLDSVTDHSLFALAKRLLFPWFNDFGALLPIFLVLGTAACLAVWFLRLRAMPAGNQIAFASLAMITLMPTSMGYTLLHVYIPFAIVGIAVAASAQAGQKLPGAVPLMLGFALLTVPLQWMVHRGTFLSAPFQCILLLALMALTLCFNIPPLSFHSSEVSLEVGPVG